jgi:hypothetical protein
VHDRDIPSPDISSAHRGSSDSPQSSAHNQVRDVITSFLSSALRPAWTLFEEIRKAKTALVHSTPLADVDQLGRRQPDWILVSEVHTNIAIVDLSCPSDVHQAQQLVAAIRKQQTYQPLVDGLSYYTEQGWVVHVFPWVVGIWGMIDSSHMDSHLKFLGNERKHWQVAVERTALASVRVFHFLHKVPFGGPLERVQFDWDSSIISSASDEDATISVTKRYPESISDNPALVDSDLASPEPVRPLEEAQQPQRPRYTPSTSPVTAVAEVETLAPDLPTGGTPNPVILCVVPLQLGGGRLETESNQELM